MALSTVSYSSTVSTCVYRADLSSVSLCCVTAPYVCVCRHVQTGAALLRLVYIPETNSRKGAGICFSRLFLFISASVLAFSLSLANYFGSKDTRAQCKNTGDRGLKHTSGEELGEPFSRGARGHRPTSRRQTHCRESVGAKYKVCKR